jgi:hypothetical protein
VRRTPVIVARSMLVRLFEVLLSLVNCEVLFGKGQPDDVRGVWLRLLALRPRLTLITVQLTSKVDNTGS